MPGSAASVLSPPRWSRTIDPGWARPATAVTMSSTVGPPLDPGVQLLRIDVPQDRVREAGRRRGSPDRGVVGTVRWTEDRLRRGPRSPIGSRPPPGRRWSTMPAVVMPVRSVSFHDPSPTLNSSGCVATRARTDRAVGSVWASWPELKKVAGIRRSTSQRTIGIAVSAGPPRSNVRPTTFDWRDPCVTRSPVPSAGGDSTGPTLSEADGLGDPSTGDSPGPSFLTPGRDRQLPADLDPVRVVLRAVRVERRVGGAGSSRRCSGPSS